MVLLGQVIVTRTHGFLDMARDMARDTEYITRWRAEIEGRRELTALQSLLTAHWVCRGVVLWNDGRGVGLTAPLHFSYYDQGRQLLVMSFACTPTAYTELTRGNVMAPMARPVTKITHDDPPTGFLIVEATHNTEQVARVVIPLAPERGAFRGTEPLGDDAWAQLHALLATEVASN